MKRRLWVLAGVLAMCFGLMIPASTAKAASPTREQIVLQALWDYVDAHGTADSNGNKRISVALTEGGSVSDAALSLTNDKVNSQIKVTSAVVGEEQCDVGYMYLPLSLGKSMKVIYGRTLTEDTSIVCVGTGTLDINAFTTTTSVSLTYSKTEYSESKENRLAGALLRKMAARLNTLMNSYIEASLGDLGFTAYCDAKLAANAVEPVVLKSVENRLDGIRVEWEAAQADVAIGYELYRRVKGTEAWEKVIYTTKTVYTDKDANLTGGVTYSYCVKVVSAKIRSLTISARSRYLSRLYLKAITADLLKLSNVTSGIQLKWPRVAGAEGYKIYRKVNGGTSALIRTIEDGDKTSYINTAVKADTTYTYYVKPYAGSTTVSGGSKTITRLSAPGEVKAAMLRTGVKVSWTKCSGADGYQVYRSDNGSDYQLVKKVGDVSSFTDTGATANGRDYSYKVRACQTSGSDVVTGNFSEEARIPCYLKAVEITSRESSEAGTITLTWERNAKAYGYEISYARNSSFDNMKKVSVSGSSTLTTTLTGLKSGGKYFLRVRLYRTVDGKKVYSAWSGYKSIVAA